MSQDVSPQTPTRWTQPNPTAHPDRSTHPTPSGHTAGQIPLAPEPWVQIPLYPPLSHPDRSEGSWESAGAGDSGRNHGSRGWVGTPPPEESTWEHSPGQFSVDAYADSLMNDLFGEVEHILDTGAAPPRAEEQPEFIAIKPLPVRQIHLPPELVTPTEAESAEHQVIEAEVTPVTPRSDRILRGAALVSCGMALGLSLLDPDRYTPLVLTLRGESPTATALTPALDPAAVAQQDFIRYLERSLELLEQKQTALAEATPTPPGTTPAAANPTNPPGNLPAPALNSDLPTVAVASTLPGQTVLPPVGIANPNPPTVLERVYIPVYGNAAPGTGVVSPIPGLTLNPPTPAAPAPGTAIAALPQPPGAPSTAPAALTPPAAAVAPLPVAATHTLMGLLELGDRSAALFEINGVTRRIHLGEAIGSSGWTLVEVANQEAIMRRNGEVRSVYVGQSF